MGGNQGKSFMVEIFWFDGEVGVRVGGEVYVWLLNGSDMYKAEWGLCKRGIKMKRDIYKLIKMESVIY